MQPALDLLDISSAAAAGRWTSMVLTWDEVQVPAGSTLLMPSTIYQGSTTTCGAICILETMATHRPAI